MTARVEDPKSPTLSFWQSCIGDHEVTGGGTHPCNRWHFFERLQPVDIDLYYCLMEWTEQWMKNQSREAFCFCFCFFLDKRLLLSSTSVRTSFLSWYGCLINFCDFSASLLRLWWRFALIPDCLLVKAPSSVCCYWIILMAEKTNLVSDHVLLIFIP